LQLREIMKGNEKSEKIHVREKVSLSFLEVRKVWTLSNLLSSLSLSLSLSLISFRKSPSGLLQYSLNRTKPLPKKPVFLSFSLSLCSIFYSGNSKKKNKCGKNSPANLVSENPSKLLKLMYSMPTPCKFYIFVFWA